MILRTVSLGILLQTTGAFAQFDKADVPPSDAPVAVAASAEEIPLIDGNVLGDPAWSAATPLTGFWQTAPDEGRPASEETEVRLLYTSSMLFVGVVCYDREPSRIIVADSRRDAALDETDSFRFILDTYRDLQNGFIFGTNPASVEYDAQVVNEGQGGGGFGGGFRFQSGSGGGVNVNWDGAWEVRALTGDFGWSAEFAIPFRTLRFSGGGLQEWGINFERTIFRRHETSYWAPLPRQYSLPRVSLAGSLRGLDIPAPRNLQLVPYALVEMGDTGSAAPRPEFGVDLKYSITTSLTLDATYNTDFAQVEADEQQINLDRFNLFFPEKRPFFLENAGLFSVGQPGEVELFFSRRIGISGDQAVPILAGARVSGDVGGMKVGVLNMQTEQVGALGVPANNFGVARVRRELPNRTFVGGLLTNRQSVGEFGGSSDYNRVAAIDGQLGFGRYGSLSGFLARSWTPGLSGSQHAFRFNAGYDSESWLLDAEYSQVAEGFNPEIGFLQRFAYRKASGLVFRRFRPDFLGFHELRPHASYNGYWGMDGLYESGFLHVDNHWEWQSGYEIHTGVNFTHEGVRNAFEIVDGAVVPAGSYNHRELMLVGNTDESKWISFSSRLIVGGFFGGNRVTVTPAVQMRAGESFNSEFSWSRNEIDLPSTDFATNLLRARLSYSFTPRLHLQTLIQYNDAADLWSANLRFGWLQTAGTGLFVVLNHVSAFDAAIDSGLEGQTLVVKYTRLFDVLD